jgi:methyl-accepting chemotaxis protein
VATQGRAFWVLDDLSVVQQADAGISNKNMHVFGINDSWHMSGFQSSNLRNAGMNPPNGVVVNYYLKDFKEGDALNITVMDKDKKIIRAYSTTAEKTTDKFEAAAGMNQFVWNMQYPGVDRIENMVIWNGNIESVKAPPGKYYFRFNTAKDSAMAEATIKAPPIYKATQQDYEDQFRFLMAVKDKFAAVQQGVKNIRELRQQMNDLATRQGKDYPKEIKAYADSISKQMTGIEEALHQTKAKSGQDVLNYPIRLNDKLSGLFDVANSSAGAPTRQVRDAFAELSAKADEQLAKLRQIMTVDVPKLNDMIREKAVPVIGLKKE